MTDAERLQFIEQIAVYVQKHAPTYGILVYSPIIAQACLESAYGTSNKAQYHNYFGLKYRGDRVSCASGYFSDTSSEQNADGSYTTITTDWYKFDDMDSGVEGYFQFTNISLTSVSCWQKNCILRGCPCQRRADVRALMIILPFTEHIRRLWENPHKKVFREQFNKKLLTNFFNYFSPVRT